METSQGTVLLHDMNTDELSEIIRRSVAIIQQRREEYKDTLRRCHYNSETDSWDTIPCPAMAPV